MNPITHSMYLRRCGYVISTLAVGVLFVTLGGRPPVLAQAPSEDDLFAGKTAWQADEKLGEKWQEITGRFIFQRTCLSCHPQGAATFTRKEWEQKLPGFPDEGHAALLPEEFGDLTALFAYGRMVPNDQARYQALEKFLLKYAPEEKATGSAKDPPKAVDLFPAVGQKAPEFSIVDTEGRKHTLKGYIQNQQALILVFSRAHW